MISASNQEESRPCTCCINESLERQDTRKYQHFNVTYRAENLQRWDAAEK